MRPIDVQGYGPIAAHTQTGAVPMLQWLPLASLVVDDEYQRPITSQGRRNVVRIAEVFDWSMFAPVVVSPVEGGHYAIVDGQHRATAACLRGIESLPCMVIIADRPKQAAAFRAINGQTTQVSRLQIHRAAVTAGDADALAIEEACAFAGVRLVSSRVIAYHSAYGEAAAMTASVQAIKALLAQYGAPETVIAMRAVALASSDGRSLLSGYVLKAVSAVLHGQPEWLASEARLMAVFEETDLGDLLVRARQQAISQRGVDVSTLLEKELRQHLTKAMRRAA